MKHRFVLILLLIITCIEPLSAQTVDQKKNLDTWIAEWQARFPMMGRFRIKDVKINNSKKSCTIYVNSNFSSIPFREALLKQMQKEVLVLLGNTYEDYKVVIFAEDVDVSMLIPNYYRADSQLDKKRLPNNPQKHPEPFVSNLDKPYATHLGLNNRNIALWHSHGWYYDQLLDRWEWQRARVFETVEDKFTMAYVLPFLVPMLENAGAHVLLPRERDTQIHEVVVDNDSLLSGSYYLEYGDLSFFKTSKLPGFAQKRAVYTEQENPFIEGTCRWMRTDTALSASVEWVANIPESGYYWVSIAYQGGDKQISDAHYTVYHAAGSTEFLVNQRMGGGTWIYLGQFYFHKGVDPNKGKVTLTNKSTERNHWVAADAVRFGGGMGNIARRPADEEMLTNVKSSSDEQPKLISAYKKESFTLSQRARYLEGARYWMQWAGMPFDVYSFTKGLNDYTDDYASRGLWVNYLNGGSVYAPDSMGLSIPIDLSLAFHTDAGVKKDTIIGTLGIYTTEVRKKGGERSERFPNGQSRYASHDLTDLVMTSITEDIRATYEPNWTRRGMWNRSYAESRRPEVPAMLLELLSHQNYADMQYGLDPRFQFLVSRSIYKGILRFVATQNDIPYRVQPLPVSHFRTAIVGDSVTLSWRAVADSLEPSAVAEAYVVYTRKEDKGFDNGLLVRDTMVTLPLPKNMMMSYKVTAVNEGGESFPSEVLAVCHLDDASQKILVINGFDRVSAPQGFSDNVRAGFPEWMDRGVPYIQSLSYVGAQHNFDYNSQWLDDDAPGFGASNSNYETMLIAGNTFDYSYTHGVSISQAGYSFASCSNEAAEEGLVKLSDYRAIDLILGKQRECSIGRNNALREFKTFTPKLQKILTDYCLSGGALLVTGAYVGTDLWSQTSTAADQQFAQNILKFKWRTDHAAQNGQVAAVYAPGVSFAGEFQYSNTLNEQIYAVESPDGIEPIASESFTVMRYQQNNISAAVAYKGSYRTLVCGFPFETLVTPMQRYLFMKQALEFLAE